MEKCRFCGNLRFCLWRGKVPRCLACTLEDISSSLSDLVTDLGALAKTASAGQAAGVSTQRCTCGRGGALEVPYFQNVCIFCIAEGLGRRLESIRQELQAALQACAYCGDTAKYLWANQLPLCGVCTVTAALCGEPPQGPRS